MALNPVAAGVESTVAQIAKRFVPLMDRVLVQRIKAEARTKSGIFLPESSKGASNVAQILAVGTGRVGKAGHRIDMEVKVGDVVVVPDFGGSPLKLEESGELLHVFRQDDIIGIVRNN